MRLFNDYISLVCSADKLSVSLEKLSPIGLNGPVTLDMIKSFFKSKRLHHINWDIVKHSLDNCVIEENVQNRKIVELQQPKINLKNYGSFEDEKTAQNWLKDLSKASENWKLGLPDDDLKLSYFKKGDIVLDLIEPSETDCFGNPVSVWNPIKWLSFEDGFEEKVTAEGAQVIAKYNGYLFGSSECLYLKKLDFLSEDEMVRYALLVKPNYGLSLWNNEVSTLEEKYSVSLTKDLSFGKVELERGVEPTPAIEGSLEQHVLNGDNWFEQVFQGQVLYSISPSREAKPGQTLTLKKVEPEVKKIEPISLNCGEGVFVEVDEDGVQHYKSKIDGAVQQKGKEIWVQEVLAVPKNLSVYMSPIYFNGPVEVMGDILDGVVVECNDLKVKGTVENNVQIQVKYGVNVDGGLLGAETAIKCESFEGHHVQDATIRAERNIIINAYAYRANLYSGKSIVVNGENLPKGSQALVGGVANAFENIEVHSVGSKMCTTICAVGIDLELWEKCEMSKEISRKLYKEIKEINKNIPMDLIKSKSRNDLSEVEQENIVGLLGDLKKAMKKREELMNQLNDDRSKCVNINKKNVYFKWNHHLKPDVLVMVGELERQFRNSRDKATLVKELNQKIKIELQD